MTGKFLVIFILILARMTQIPAFASKGKDYSEELERLDEILSRKEIYVQYLKDRINILKSVLDEQDDLSQIYGINMRIAGEFRSYSLDSTMAYLGKCRSIALQLEDSVKLIETDIATAEEYTLGGYHLEAQAILHRLESEQIPQSLRYQYLKARHNLAGELMAYANDNRIFREQDSLRTVFRNALLAMAEPGTFDWYMLKMEEAVQYGRAQEAKECAGKLVDVSEEGSHEYAIACYHYQDMLGENAPLEEKMLWLIRSAYTDVMCATKDYASLNFLASDLFSCGDIDRAFSYTAAHCMPDAIFFGGKLRPWQIAMFFPEIGKAYQDKNTRWQRSMNAMVTAMAALITVMVVLLVFIYMRQRVLDKTRKALQTSYLAIEHRNQDLIEANRKLSDLNAKILESDKIKQEYITLFLSILSENINTIRQYKNHVLKYIRRGNAADIVAEIEALPPIDEDITEFYKMFDTTFLNLYPDFVDKFNSLLAEGEAITTKGDDTLTPELRVFALIKLGIADSSKIASLLHYSANTIYNYRAKIKNKAKGDRAGFEEAVKTI